MVKWWMGYVGSCRLESQSILTIFTNKKLFVTKLKFIFFSFIFFEKPNIEKSVFLTLFLWSFLEPSLKVFLMELLLIKAI